MLMFGFALPKCRLNSQTFPSFFFHFSSSNLQRFSTRDGSYERLTRLRLSTASNGHCIFYLEQYSHPQDYFRPVSDNDPKPETGIMISSRMDCARHHCPVIHIPTKLVPGKIHKKCSWITSLQLGSSLHWH